jgi:surfeit locus 1 family protein
LTVIETPQIPQRRKWRVWIAFVLLPAALAVLLALGTWQVQRLIWKEDLLSAIEQRSQAEPVGLAEIEAALEASEPIEYRTAFATGRFVNSGEQHFFATFNGQSGFYVYTPLELADGRYLFVNRGFVPYDLKEPETRPESLLEGEQRITGLARANLRKSRPSWFRTMMKREISSTGRTSTGWPQMRACQPARSCRSSSMPMQRRCPAACPGAASR